MHNLTAGRGAGILKKKSPNMASGRPGRRSHGPTRSGKSSAVDGRVIQVNKRIAILGKERKLNEALEAFESLGHKGMVATDVTFNVILYACVRCGEVDKAKKLFQQLCEETSIKPNVVTFTTLLKGLCVVGDMAAAELLLV